MDHVRLGSTGLRVSRICLGTMTFGLQSDEATSRAILDSADEAGVTFLDTADVYPARGPVGLSEEILGRWLEGRRDRFIVASKCASRVGPSPWDEGNSKKHVLDAVDASLRRLRTDYLDLYQLHHFDPHTPIDESLGALDHLVQVGKVRYTGCSNWLAYQVALALGRSDVRGIERFATVQPRYSLLHRPAERGLFPLCLDQGIGVLPYNPLAGGLLTGKHSAGTQPEPDTRFGISPVYRDLYWHDREFDTIGAIAQLAGDAGMPMATMSIAWGLSDPAVTAAIIGASGVGQLEETIAGSATTIDPASRPSSIGSPCPTSEGPLSSITTVIRWTAINRECVELTKPMDGVRILDLSIALTGPYAATLLADQGAEVIKVERPGVGDLARWIGVSVNGMSALYLMCNRGKRSIAVNLNDPEGVAIVRTLAARSDVVIENFRPGVMDRMGLGDDAVRAVNPDVVYASLSGFGSVGPYRDRSAYDTVIQAYAGVASNQADPADGVPVFLRQTVADKVTALFASQAITAALFAGPPAAGDSTSSSR